MEAEELEAKAIFNDFYLGLKHLNDYTIDEAVRIAKECSLIHVDRMIEYMKPFGNSEGIVAKWQSVKQNIKEITKP